MAADVSTEYRLLAIYHENRKSKSRAKPKYRFVNQGFSFKEQQPSFDARAGVPASAPTGKTAGLPPSTEANLTWWTLLI